MTLLEDHLAAEVHTHGEVRLPWVAFPGLHPLDIRWRMGAGEWHLMLFSAFDEGRTREQRRAQILAAGLVPADWAWWVAGHLELLPDERGPYEVPFEEIVAALASAEVEVTGEPEP